MDIQSRISQLTAEIEEQAQRFREQQMLRRRSQRRRLADQFSNY